MYISIKDIFANRYLQRYICKSYISKHMFAKAISAKIYLQTHICKDIFAKAITANIYLRECVIVGRRRSTMCWLCAKWPPRVELPRIPSPYFGKQGQALIAAAVLTRLARCCFLKLYFSSVFLKCLMGFVLFNVARASNFSA